MTRYASRRLLIGIPSLLGIAVFTFFVLRLAPGDPIQIALDPTVLSGEDAEQYIEERRAELGLDQPLPVQFVRWLGATAQGDLGFSFVSGRPVSDIIQERVGPSVRLIGTALMIAVLVSVPLGILAALRQYGWLDNTVTTVALLGVSVPQFFLALAAIYLLSLQLGWFPTGLMREPGTSSVLGEVHHLALPASILAFGLVGPLVRYVRTALLETINEDYVTASLACGLTFRQTVFRHCFKNAMIPFITVITLQIPYLAAGALVIEEIFQWPGLGELTLSAVTSRDYPVLIGVTLVIAVLVILANLLADLIYAVADPRIRVRS